MICMISSTIAPRSLLRALGAAGGHLSRPRPAPQRWTAAGDAVPRALASDPPGAETPAPKSALTRGDNPTLVYVASKNPVKVDAVRDALALLLPEDRERFDVRGIGGVDSGVSAQPFGDAEARSRARPRRIGPGTGPSPRP